MHIFFSQQPVTPTHTISVIPRSACKEPAKTLEAQVLADIKTGIDFMEHHLGNIWPQLRKLISFLLSFITPVFLSPPSVSQISFFFLIPHLGSPRCVRFYFIDNANINYKNISTFVLICQLVCLCCGIFALIKISFHIMYCKIQYFHIHRKNPKSVKKDLIRIIQYPLTQHRIPTVGTH